MVTTVIQGAPYPAYGSLPDVPADLRALAEWVELRLNMRFASASARDLAITAPVEGMKTWLQDVNRWSTYNGAAWVDQPQVLTAANSTDRTAKIPAPVAGDLCYLQDAQRWDIYNGSGWGRSSPLSTNADRRRVGGSVVLSTNGSGDSDLNTGLSNVEFFMAWNGDAGARGSITMGNMRTLWPGSSNTTIRMRTYTSSTGAALTSNTVRVDWLAWGAA